MTLYGTNTSNIPRRKQRRQCQQQVGDHGEHHCARPAIYHCPRCANWFCRRHFHPVMNLCTLDSEAEVAREIS